MARTKKKNEKPIVPWRNRIVREGEEAPDQLLAHPRQWRIHPGAQQSALEGVLSQVGWVQRVIVSQRTGHVLDGHLRVMLALRRGEPTVPVVYVDVDEAEEDLILATIDPLSAMASADEQKLGELLAGVQTGDEAIKRMLAELAEEVGVEGYGRTPPDDPGAQMDKAEELQKKWGVKSGDLWGLGKGTRCPKCGRWHDLLEGDTG